MNSEFNYMLLGRLISDCKYYLGEGHHNEAKLWAGNMEEQIDKMYELYNGFTVKPEWTSLEEIDTLASLMRDTKKGKKTYEVNLYPFYGSLLETFVTTAENEVEALEGVVAQLVNENNNELFYEVDSIQYLAEYYHQEEEDYAAEAGLLYVDATMSGADRPVYIDGLNLKIFEI